MPVRKRKPIVVKLGGSTLGNHDTSIEDLVALQAMGQPIVVVHGGGAISTAWLTRLGIPTRFVRGLRVTDAETLKVVVAALAGLVNKELVAAIQARGGRAVGLCGVDGGLLRSRIKNAELGYVGEVTSVDLRLVTGLLDMDYIPLVAPLSLEAPAESAEAGYILNVNGDTVAGEIAAALGGDTVVFLTDVSGVRNAAGESLQRLTAQEARGLIASGVASGGMVPKIEACLRAVTAVPQARIVDGREPHALLREVEGKGGGTTIVAG